MARDNTTNKDFVDAEVIPPQIAVPDGPNAVVDPDPSGVDDILNNPLSGFSASEQAVINQEKPPVSAGVEGMMSAMLRVAESMEKITARQEATRQLTYAEIKPDSPWNPEGRRDLQKLTRPTTLQGIFLNPLTLTEDEIKLFNQLKPGRYLDRRVEVRQGQDGSVDLSWPGAKMDPRIQMYSQFPSLTPLLQAVIAERKAKEERHRKGLFSDEDVLA